MSARTRAAALSVAVLALAGCSNGEEPAPAAEAVTVTAPAPAVETVTVEAEPTPTETVTVEAPAETVTIEAEPEPELEAEEPTDAEPAEDASAEDVGQYAAPNGDVTDAVKDALPDQGPRSIIDSARQADGVVVVETNILTDDLGIAARPEHALTICEGAALVAAGSAGDAFWQVEVNGADLGVIANAAENMECGLV